MVAQNEKTKTVELSEEPCPRIWYSGYNVDVTYCNYMPIRASLAVTKGLLFLWMAHLNNKNDICKQRSSLFGDNRLQIALFTFEETSN